MASLNYTVEDGSPLIDYNPVNAWTDASIDNDALTTSYSGGSYHFTTTKDAAASFKFDGTGVWVFGAKRPNYGDYTITVDGIDVTSADAQSSQDQLKQVLGSRSNMDYGTHTVVLSSSGSNRIDIDYIEVQTRLSGDQIKTTTIEDNDPAVNYGPSTSDWSVNSRDIFTGSSLHFSQTKGASATLSFSGDAVGVYGTTSPDHADMRIVVDGQTTSLPGGSGGRISSLHSQVLLYFKDSLGPGLHSLSIFNDQKSETAPFIDLDAVLVYSTTNTQGSSGSNQVSETHSSVPTGAIIGAAVGGTAGLILLIGLLLFLYRRRRQRAERDDSLPPMTPVLPLQRPRMSEVPIRSETQDTDRFDVPRPFATHSRGSSDASSAVSSMPLIRDVPLLNAPKLPSHARSTSSGSTPMRPMQRPPTLEFPG